MYQSREQIKSFLDDYVNARLGSAGLISTPPEPGQHSLSAERYAEEAADRFLDALTLYVVEAIASGVRRDAPWAKDLKRSLR